MSSGNELNDNKDRQKKLKQKGLEELKEKHLYSKLDSNSLADVNLQLVDIATAWSSSPSLYEYLEQFDHQNKILSEQFKNLTTSLDTALSPHKDMLLEINKSVSSIVDQYTNIQNPLLKYNEVFNEHIKLFQDMLEQQKEVFKKFTVEVSNSIRNFIPRDALIRIELHSKYWLIVDSGLLLEISEQNFSEEADVIQFVIDHYKKNDWRESEKLIESWSTHIDFERVKVFKAAIYVAKTLDENKDIHLLTAPSLIAQIDGLVRDLQAALPTTQKKRIERKIKQSLTEERKGKRPDPRNDVAVHTVAELVDFWSAKILQEVIFNGLFRDSNKIKPEDSYSLFRHKILHGEKDYVKFQDEEAFIRLMLFADFIVKLIIKMKDNEGGVTNAVD